MKRIPAVLSLFAILSCPGFRAFADGFTPEKAFPAPACAEGYVLREKIVLYDKETLFDRIDGEAELYFPYGFGRLASARYANERDPRAAVEADVYEMGSLLDAFGIFSNYRRREDKEARIAGEGTVSPSQLIFYQGRFFVRLQASGAASLPEEVFLACARAVARNLPADGARPKELGAFAIPEAVPRSERYIARSLLGYDFFRRGLVADALVEGESGQVFLVIEDSADAAARTLDRYRSFLASSGKGPAVPEEAGRETLAAVDPLYGNIRIAREGRFLVGAIRFARPSAAERLVERMRRRSSFSP
jgi:hypothetical protein